VPDFDVTIGHYTLVPNPFWGGALFPLLVFLFLYLTPWLERRLTGEYGFRNLLDRPRDAPWRTALGAALFTWVFLIFLAGASDRVFVSFGVSYQAQIWVYRVLVFVLPMVALFVTRRLCLALQESDRLGRIREEAEAEARGELPQPE
jgi:ubiquinol-cytochrome c reductase cytochrome b subunit